MFSIDFESSRFKSAMRTLQYAFLTVFVVVGTIILVYAGQGYDINRQTGEVIQNGLLLVNSTPTNATVFINNKPETDLAPGRFPLPQGAYDIRLELNGYRPWTKQVSVSGSAVEWLYYPRLIPTDLVTANVSALRNVDFIGQSPGGQTFLVRQRSNAATFNLISISDSALTNDEQIQVDSDLFELRTSGGRFGKMSFEGWAGDARSVLISHAIGSRLEYVLLNVEEPSQSLNLSSEYDLDLRDVRFINGQANQLYALVGQDLRRLNLDNSTISTPLVRDVNRYVLYEDRFILYLRTDEEAGLQLGLIEDGADEPITLQNLAGKANRYRLEFAGYDNEFHLALLDTDRGRATVMVDPHLRPEAEEAPQQFAIPTPGARFLSFSRNGQYLLAQGGSDFYTHDFDRDRRHSFTVSFEVPADSDAKWLDGNYLYAYDDDDAMHFFEFDGGNEHEIVTANPDFNVFVDSDFETIYTFTVPEADGRLFMRSTSLTVQPVN